MSLPTVKHLVYFEDGEESVEFPARYEVCGRCSGTGKHVNPSIDGNGLSYEDFAEDPDFEEAYFSGQYDVTCEACNGLRVVAEIDEPRMTLTQQVAYDLLLVQWDDEAASRRESEMERRMGA